MNTIRQAFEQVQTGQEQGRIVCADVLETLAALPDGGVHLALTSPPYYNAREEYASWDSYESYLAWWGQVIRGIERVLDPQGGRLVININEGYSQRPWLPLSSDTIQLVKAAGLELRGVIVWDKGQQNTGHTAWGSWCSPSAPYFRERHETIIVAFRNEWRIPRRGESDLTAEEFPYFTQSLHHIRAAQGTKHPAPFPLELPWRFIKLLSWVGDLVFDPFMGSGTTAEACLRLGRRWFGCDYLQEYVSMAHQRLAVVRAELEQPVLFPALRPILPVTDSARLALLDRLLLQVSQLRTTLHQGRHDSIPPVTDGPEVLLAWIDRKLREEL